MRDIKACLDAVDTSARLGAKLIFAVEGDEMSQERGKVQNSVERCHTLEKFVQDVLQRQTSWEIWATGFVKEHLRSDSLVAVVVGREKKILLNLMSMGISSQVSIISVPLVLDEMGSKLGSSTLRAKAFVFHDVHFKYPT